MAVAGEDVCTSRDRMGLATVEYMNDKTGSVHKSHVIKKIRDHLWIVMNDDAAPVCYFHIETDVIGITTMETKIMTACHRTEELIDFISTNHSIEVLAPNAVDGLIQLLTEDNYPSPSSTIPGFSPVESDADSHGPLYDDTTHRQTYSLETRMINQADIPTNIEFLAYFKKLIREDDKGLLRLWGICEMFMEQTSNPFQLAPIMHPHLTTAYDYLVIIYKKLICTQLQIEQFHTLLDGQIIQAIRDILTTGQHAAFSKLEFIQQIPNNPVYLDIVNHVVIAYPARKTERPHLPLAVQRCATMLSLFMCEEQTFEIVCKNTQKNTPYILELLSPDILKAIFGAIPNLDKLKMWILKLVLQSNNPILTALVNTLTESDAEAFTFKNLCHLSLPISCIGGGGDDDDNCGDTIGLHFHTNSDQLIIHLLKNYTTSDGKLESTHGRVRIYCGEIFDPKVKFSDKNDLYLKFCPNTNGTDILIPSALLQFCREEDDFGSLYQTVLYFVAKICENMPESYRQGNMCRTNLENWLLAHRDEIISPKSITDIGNFRLPGFTVQKGYESYYSYVEICDSIVRIATEAVDVDAPQAFCVSVNSSIFIGTAIIDDDEFTLSVYPNTTTQAMRVIGLSNNSISKAINNSHPFIVLLTNALNYWITCIQPSFYAMYLYIKRYAAESLLDTVTKITFNYIQKSLHKHCDIDLYGWWVSIYDQYNSTYSGSKIGDHIFTVLEKYCYISQTDLLATKPCKNPLNYFAIYAVSCVISSYDIFCNYLDKIIKDDTLAAKLKIRNEWILLVKNPVGPGIFPLNLHTLTLDDAVITAYYTVFPAEGTVNIAAYMGQQATAPQLYGWLLKYFYAQTPASRADCVIYALKNSSLLDSVMTDVMNNEYPIPNFILFGDENDQYTKWLLVHLFTGHVERRWFLTDSNNQRLIKTSIIEQTSSQDLVDIVINKWANKSRNHTTGTNIPKFIHAVLPYTDSLIMFIVTSSDMYKPFAYIPIGSEICGASDVTWIQYLWKTILLSASTLTAFDLLPNMFIGKNTIPSTRAVLYNKPMDCPVLRPTLVVCNKTCDYQILGPEVWVSIDGMKLNKSDPTYSLVNNWRGLNLSACTKKPDDKDDIKKTTYALAPLFNIGYTLRAGLLNLAMSPPTSLNYNNEKPAYIIKSADNPANYSDQPPIQLHVFTDKNVYDKYTAILHSDGVIEALTDMTS